MNPIEYILHRRTRIRSLCLSAILLTSTAHYLEAADAAPKWEPCGWGGGAFYYSNAFDPVNDGVIYMGGDCNGIYKTTDHGKNWRIINNGLADYGVFTLAVDPSNPQIVYAATELGLCKSTNGGEEWQLLPNTGPKELRITGEKNRVVRSIAVDPKNGNNIYAGSPSGKVYRSTDGGQTWSLSYEKQFPQEDPGVLRVQYGKLNGAPFAGIWCNLAFPAGVKAEDAVGFGFSFKGNKVQQKVCFVMLTTSSGAVYRSKNITEIFNNDQWQDVVLKAGDFSIDPDYAKKKPDIAKTQPATPNWSTVNRMDLSCNGDMADASIARFNKLFFAVTHSADGQTGTAEKPILVTVKDFTASKAMGTYGNVRVGDEVAGPAYSVAVAAKNPSLVIASTDGSGLILSDNGGQTWTELNTPKKASSAVFAETDPNIIYGAFLTNGLMKSVDMGKTWKNISQGLAVNGKNVEVREVVVSPTNPQDVYVLCAADWNGYFFYSNDGGTTWTSSSSVTVDSVDSPLYYGKSGKDPLSKAKSLAINPRNPKELFISANWRPCISQDGGHSWTEASKGADMFCVYDIRFSKNKVYVSGMDEGTFVSESNGKSWRQLWPKKFQPDLIGHNWRLAVNEINGVDRIIATCSPWVPKFGNRIVRSDDGGKTFSIITAGLPENRPSANTMWGMGYARALAADPNDPQIIYMGIDGDVSSGNKGGGVFKSKDGGNSWEQLAKQPGSRRMFLGLAVDPSDSKRVYWGACGSGGGLYRSDDGGGSWQSVFNKEAWIFNVLVTKEGVVYCPGKQLWRSTDHGATWKKLTDFKEGRQICGMEVDPRDPKTMWISATTWNGSSNGAVYKTTDDGATWQEITGDLPYRKPIVLRFNPATNELWAGGVGLYKTKQ